MNEQRVIREMIEATSALIVSFERQQAVYPHDRSISINLRSLEKSRRRLESELAEALTRQGAALQSSEFKAPILSIDPSSNQNQTDDTGAIA